MKMNQSVAVGAKPADVVITEILYRHFSKFSSLYAAAFTTAIDLLLGISVL